MKMTARLRLWSAALVLAASQVAVAQTGVPAFKVTTPNGVVSVLLGTLHVPAAGLRQPADSVLAGARHFVVEQVGAPVIGPRFLSPAAPLVVVGGRPRADWARNLSNEQLETLVQRAHCNQPATDADKARQALDFMLTRGSAMLLQSVALSYCAPPGLKSRDRLLEDAATAAGLVPQPLESATEVADQRDQVSEAFWRYSLAVATASEGQRRLLDVVSALNYGDFDAVRAMLLEAPHNVDAAAHWAVMVDQRNRAWMPRLCQRLDDGPSVVLVGVAHLAGPGGLVARLREAGYRVERTELPARPDGR